MDQCLVAESDRLRLHAARFQNGIADYLTRSEISFSTPANHWVTFGLGIFHLESATMRGIDRVAEYESGGLTARLGWNHALTSRFCARPGKLHRRPDLCNAGGFQNSCALQHVPPRNQIRHEPGYSMLDDRFDLGARISYFSHRFADITVPAASEIPPLGWVPYTQVVVAGS